MKTLVALLLVSSTTFAQQLPISPITVDCRYAIPMSNDLSKIIADPSNSNRAWDKLFATVLGSQTDQQRIQSAKVILWTIRTQCAGF